MSVGVVWVKRDRLLKHLTRSPSYALPCREGAGRKLRCSLPPLRTSGKRLHPSRNLRRESGHDLLRDAVLQCKNVLEVPVIVLCPKVITSSSPVHLPPLLLHTARHLYPSILAAGPIYGIQLGWHPTRFGNGRFRAVRSKEPIVHLH